MTKKRMARRTPSGRTVESPSAADDDTAVVESPLVPLPEPEQHVVESPLPISSFSPGERRTKLGARKSVKHAANVVEDASASPSGVAPIQQPTIAEVLNKKQRDAAALRVKSKKTKNSKPPSRLSAAELERASEEASNLKPSETAKPPPSKHKTAAKQDVSTVSKRVSPRKPMADIALGYERRTKHKHSDDATVVKKLATVEPKEKDKVAPAAPAEPKDKDKRSPAAAAEPKDKVKRPAAAHAEPKVKDKRAPAEPKETVKRAPAAPAEVKKKVKWAPAAPAEASEPAEHVKASSSKPVKPAEESKKRKTRASESVNVSSPSKQSEQPLKKQKGDKETAGKEKVEKKKAGKEKVEEKVEKKKVGKDKVEKESGRKGKKVVDENPVQSSKLPSVRIRTTPKALYNVLSCLKENQKEAVREMGFGSLLSMRLDEISGTLGYYVVKNFDVFDLELKLPAGSIKVTPQVVHDILGIPMGEKELLDLPTKDLKVEGVYSVGCWRSQFGKSIRPSHVSALIINSDDSGLVFKLNFLMLFASTMLCCDGSGGCSASCQSAIVSRISEQTEFHKINWCGFLIDQLKNCKNYWNPADKTYYFTGPMTFLQLLYVDSTLFEKFPIVRERPAIRYWNSTYLNKRVAIELESNKDFGRCPLQPAFSEHIVEEGFIASTSGQQADQASSQTSTEEYLMQLDNLLNKGVSLFPGDLRLSELNDKFRQLFREGKSSTQPDDDDGGDDDDGDDDGEDDAKDDDVSASEKPDPKDKDGDKDGSAPGGDDGKADDGSAAPGGGDDGDADKDGSGPVGDKDGDADKDASAPVSDNAAQLDQIRETVENNPKDDDDDIDGDHVTLGDPGNNFEDSAFDDWFSDPAFEEAFEKVNQMAKPQSFTSLEDVAGPSFSLLSQDYSSPPSCAPILLFDTASPRPVVVLVAECSPSVVPQEAAEHEGKVDLKQHPKLKRLIKPSKYYSSPYKSKQTDVLAAATDLEFAVSGSIFSMQGNPMEVVFETSSGYMSYRVVMESLAPSCLVYSNVIDTWSLILNEEQRRAGSISRLFLHTSIITSSMWDGNLSFDKSYEIFASNMLVTMEDDVEMLSMRDVNLVFFPIVAREHYYLIVFNLKRVAFNIIDNSAACSDYNVKYKETASVVHDLFAKHLETYGHPKASSIAKAKPHVLKMKWRTLNNHVDCGVFLMCHMDTYNADSVSNWNPGLLTETATGKVTQKLQLTKLRMKYATKILLHDINIQKDKMVANADEFAKLDFAVGKEMINQAIKDRVARASRA